MCCHAQRAIVSLTQANDATTKGHLAVKLAHLQLLHARTTEELRNRQQECQSKVSCSTLIIFQHDNRVQGIELEGLREEQRLSQTDVRKQLNDRE